MKWLKKQFNKIFLSGEDETDLEYWENEEYEENLEQQQDTQQPKKKFIFPVVDDYVQFDKKTKIDNDTNHIVNGKLTLPKHLKQDGGISKVYDVEVSGIRELLDRRKSSSGRKTTSSDRVQTIPKRPTFEEQPISYREKEKKVEFSKPNVVEKRKKFVPTKVPSPVYGFASPKKKESSIIHSGKTFDEIQREMEEKKSGIVGEVRENNVQVPRNYINTSEQNELHISNAQQEQVVSTLDKSEKTETSENHIFEQDAITSVGQSELNTNEEGKNNRLDDETLLIEKEISVSSEKEILDYTSEIQLENSPSINSSFEEDSNSAIYEDVEIVEQLVSTGQVEQEDIDSIQTDKITFHNSTIHIENLNISDAQTIPTVEHVVENRQEVEEQHIESTNAEHLEMQEQSQIETRSKLPFNVLMLKSDKEKLAAKQKNEQIIEKSFAPFPATATVKSSGDTHRSIPKQYIQTISSQENIVDENAMVGSSEHVDQEESEPIVINKEKSEESIQIEEKKEQLLHEVEQSDLNDEVHCNESTIVTNTVEVIDSLEQAIASTELNEATEQRKLSTSEEEQPFTHATQQIQELNDEATEVVAETKTEEEQQLATPITNELLNEPLPYTKPPLSILAPPEEMLEDTEWMEEQGEHLVEALSHFQVQAQVESIVQGPAVTQFEITVGHGTKVSKVRNLSDDIQLALAARDIRIDAPIPGKRSIGIEIPNRVSRPVRLSEVTDSDRFQKSDSPLEAALGLDLNGNPVTLDLRKMPHGLIAGATGSGKSVCINSILVSLLYKSAPHELKLMLIDPKMVELAPFNHIPHLVSPVITDVKAATESLKWAVDEMERRYQLFMHSGTRDITRFNKLCEENKMYAQKLPYLLIVIDELADLMMMSPADVELAISRLAQKARACGIHLILATQRPSVDVITGTLKSNIPTRIAFAVSSQIDSRTIIDQQGAERLLGRGDMLYLGNGMNAPQRIQGTFVTDEEIEEVVEYVRSQGEPNYFFKSEELVQKSEIIEEQDELFEEVCRFVFSQGSASTSSIQRRYHIGYNRAARLIDMLESQGFISEQKGSKPRDVYITETMLEDMFS